MQTEKNYFAYCLDTNTKKNYFIVSSKCLKPRPDAKNSEPGVAWVTLGLDFWGGVFQSAWHESLEVDPDGGFFLDQNPDKDFEHLPTDAEFRECLVLATAFSVQELQHLVQTCNIKIPKNYKRLDGSVASGSQQLNEPQQQNKQSESAESNDKKSNQDNSMASKGSEESDSATFSPEGATPFVLPQERKEVDLEKPIDSLHVSENDYRGNSHIRPNGVANLGIFESVKDGIVDSKNADNVCVLVIHYDFKNDPKLMRNGDACDVEHLKSAFEENRNCNFRNFQSPNKTTLLQLLGDQEKLLHYFNSKDDVPSVFVLFILSHGTENGIIWTDHVDGESNNYEFFTTEEVFDSLQKLQKFEKCLKVVNFGPCRGSLDDSKFVRKNSYTKYENENSCRITMRPGMHNYVVFYSTVETTLANTADANESLLEFFTIVQNRMHHSSRCSMDFPKNNHIGQTPELKMFQQDKRFKISEAKIQEKPISNKDGCGDVSKISNDTYCKDFTWKSDEGQEIRGRRAFILCVVRSKQVKEMARALRNLDFEIKDWILNGPNIELYFETVSELKPDVGCIMTCIFAPVCENEEKEVCVRVQEGKNTPIKDILYSLVGPKNDKLIGKPKILFVVNVEAPKTDSISSDMKDLQVSATNHSGWLVLILKYEDALEKLIELLGNIGEKSLQELLESLLTFAGAGKSTVLKEMAHQLTKHDEGFKILLIPLPKYYQYFFEMPAMKVNEIEFLAKTTCNSLVDIKNWIEKRKLIVFLDGFDEVSQDVSDKIMQILIAINKARVPVFIGSRPHKVHHIQESIKNSTMVEIEPLDEAKQIEFLRSVAQKDSGDIKKLMNIFKDQDILGNPLYLNLLADYKGNGNLYDIFDTIVRRKVEISLKRENEGKDVGNQMIDKELKVIQLVASRFVTGVKIDQDSVTKEDLKKINAFGVVTYYNDTVNFTHQVFAEFLTAQKCINDLKTPVAEKVPLFNDEMVQCRKFVDLFFSTEKGKDKSYAEAFKHWTESTDRLKLVSQICRENLKQMFELLDPDLSIKDEDGKNALHFALQHLEMVKMVHAKDSNLANEKTNNEENCLHLAIDDEECSEKVALWIMQNIEVDKNAETISGNTLLLLAGKRKKWEVAQQLLLKNSVEILFTACAYTKKRRGERPAMRLKKRGLLLYWASIVLLVLPEARTTRERTCDEADEQKFEPTIKDCKWEQMRNYSELGIPVCIEISDKSNVQPVKIKRYETTVKRYAFFVPVDTKLVLRLSRKQNAMTTKICVFIVGKTGAYTCGRHIAFEEAQKIEDPRAD
ncbi:Hypothetical predicted protein [Cloeon dipterum]|uniref:NACHT domain-containing protein n=1 Tax=Cloeon dipterum TaxID=197152 RepID=A0A8S1DP93_9INSE|nr:Hypothetical predicted protein [Cloeon dipterum]